MFISAGKCQQYKRGEAMKIEVREAPHKAVLFWLSRAEAADTQMMDSLKTQFKNWKSRGYLPVIFESGEGNMEDHLYLLMKRNYEILAKKELAEEAAMRN